MTLLRAVNAVNKKFPADFQQLTVDLRSRIVYAMHRSRTGNSGRDERPLEREPQMPKGKKTLPVGPLARQIQKAITISCHDESPEADSMRRYACHVLESILMDSNNYKGFAYLDTDGKLPKPAMDWHDAAKHSRHSYLGLGEL